MNATQSDFSSLLAPLGEHRRTHISPSEGRKRKRDTKAPSDDTATVPAPSIGSHLLVGLNSVTRYLETLAANNAPATAPIREAAIDEPEDPKIGLATEGDPEIPCRPLSVVVLTHPQPSLSPSHAHIPTLLHLATVRQDPKVASLKSTRLVCLATSSDARFASALHIPRVGAIGILQGAPGAKALEDYVTKHVGLTECAWVEEALKSEWRGLNVQQA